MSNAGHNPSRPTKSHNTLNALEKMRTEALSNEELFHNSVQSFDFSAVDWDPSHFSTEPQLPSSAKQASVSKESSSKAQSHKQKLLHQDNFDDYEGGHESSDDSETSDVEQTATELRGKPDHANQKAHRPTKEMKNDRDSLSENVRQEELSTDLDATPMDFFEDNNVFRSDNVMTGSAVASDPWLGREEAPPAVPSTTPRNVSSNLRRPTMLPVAGENTIRSAAGGIKPLERRFVKPVTTRQQRQKSVGSALLVPGAKQFTRQQRQRSVGSQPLLSSMNSDFENHKDKRDSLGPSSGEDVPKVRNPRLARKRQQSFRGPFSNDGVGESSTSPPAPNPSAAGDLHDKVELNKSNRGALSIFQRARVKMNDDDGIIDGPGGELSKAAGVIGAMLKHALSGSGDGEDHAASKSPAQLNRLNPRNLFNRNKHAFMDSDELSASESSSGSSYSCSSGHDSDDPEDTGQQSTSAEDSVLAIIRAKEKSMNSTAEDKVLAMIREKERSRGLDDVSSVPSFLSDDEESSELQSRASSDAHAHRSALNTETSSHQSPRASTAENKVLAMIRAREKEANHVDSSLREELLAEDDLRVSPKQRLSSAEDKVLAMIKAKQRDSATLDEGLRAELLGENDISGPADKREMERERSKHGRSSKSNSSHSRESSTHRRRSHRRDENARKSSGSHRSSHRSSADGKSPLAHKEKIVDGQSSSHRRSSRGTDEAPGDEHLHPEASSHRHRSHRRDNEEGHEGDASSSRRSSRSKNVDAHDLSKHDEKDVSEHSRRRSGGRSHKHEAIDVAAITDDPTLMAQIKSKVKESISASSHGHRHTERSPRDSRDKLGSTWHHSDLAARGVNRSLSSTDHRPSKGRVRKIRVSVSDLYRLPSDGQAPSARKSSDTGASGSRDLRPHQSEGIEARRRRSRSMVDNNNKSS